MPVPARVRKPIPLRGRRSSWPGDAIGDEYSPNALNVRFRFGEVRQTPGRNVLSGPETNEAASAICQFPMIDGATIWPMKLATTKVMRWGNVSPANPRQWHQVQGTFIPAGSRRWSVAIGENKFFFCRGDNTIAYWDGLITSKFQQIVATDGGTVPRARFLQHLNSHLVGAFTIEGLNTFANRVRWAESGNFQKWNEANQTGAGFLDIYDESEEPIRGFLGLQDRGVVYRRRSIGDLVPTGLADPAFTFQLRVRGMGCDAPYTVASNGDGHFFLGYDRNVYFWDGISLQRIGDPIREELRAFASQALIDTYFGVVLLQRQEYWLVLGSDVFVYDYQIGAWSRDSFPSITAVAEVEDTFNVVTWSTLTTIWSAEMRHWSELSGTISTQIFASRGDGSSMVIDENIAYDYFSLGSIIDRVLETPDFYLADPMQMGTIKRVALIYEYTNNVPFEAGISTDRGRSWKTQSVVPNTTGVSLIDWNVTAQIVRFRFRENNALGTFRWRSYEYEWQSAGDFSGSF